MSFTIFFQQFDKLIYGAKEEDHEDSVSGVDRGLGFEDEQERFQSALDFMDKDFHKAQWSPGSPSTLYVSSADEDKFVRTRITRDEKDKEWRCPCCGCLHHNPKKRKRDDGADEEDKHDTHS